MLANHPGPKHPHAAPFATCACVPPAEECDIEPESPGDRATDIASTPFESSASPPPSVAGAEDNSTADGTGDALLLLAKVNDVLHSKNMSIIGGLDRVAMQKDLDVITKYWRNVALTRGKGAADEPGLSPADWKRKERLAAGKYLPSPTPFHRYRELPTHRTPLMG